MKRISYNSIDQTLVDQCENVLYQENHDGEIDLTDVVTGNATWEDGDLYTLSDFCAFALKLGVEGKDYIIEKW